MRRLLRWFPALTAIALIGYALSTPVSASARSTEADTCIIAPFEWNIVGSIVTREDRLMKVSFLAIGTAAHSGEDCSLSGEEIVIRDRGYVLFEPQCGPGGTTPLRGVDPLDYGGGVRAEFRGPITGVVTCGEGGMRRLDMDLDAKSDRGARLVLHQIGEVDLTAQVMTRLAVTGGELVLR